MTKQSGRTPQPPYSLDLSRTCPRIYRLQSTTASQRFAFSTSEQIEKFLNRHTRLTNNGTKKPALDIAGVVGHGHQARSVWVLEVVV
jgi:hypothetical protein